jgi:HTH-type transcriptional regulator/antitoxin HipB
MNFSEVIKFHRKKSGLTQNELASLAGVGKNIVYRLEHGNRTVQLATLLKVLATLNIELDFCSPLRQAFLKEHQDENS